MRLSAANANINYSPKLFRSLAFAGLFLSLCFLSACRPSNTPEAISQSFWQALVSGKIKSAKKLVTPTSKNLVQPLDKKWQDATISIGEIHINGKHARTLTTLTPIKNPAFTVTTYLIKVNNNWLIDYQRTYSSLIDDPFQSLFKQLEDIGNAMAKEIEKELPQLEKDFKSFGDKLQQQWQRFEQELKKAIEPMLPAPQKGSV